MSEEPNVVAVGAGAIGSSVVGWTAPKYRKLAGQGPAKRAQGEIEGRPAWERLA